MSNQPHEPYEPRQGHEPQPPYEPPYDPSGQPPAPRSGYEQYGDEQSRYEQSWNEQAPDTQTWQYEGQGAYGDQGAYEHQGHQGHQGAFEGQNAHGGQGHQGPYGDPGPYVDPGAYGGHASYNGQGPQENPDAYKGPAPYPHPGDGHAPSGVPSDAPQDPRPPYVPPQHAPHPPSAASAPIPPEAPVPAPTAPPRERLTAAQRARAEGRSPIIAPGLQPAALTAVLAALLAGGAALGSWGLLVPLLALQAVTAAGWFRLNGMWPARQGIALAFLGGAVADGVLLAVGREQAPAAIIGTLGVWVLLTIVLQLRNRAPADERMYGLTATVTSAALAVLAAGHLGAEPDAVVIGAAAVGVAALVRALPLPGVVSVAVALLAGAGSGIVTGSLTGVGAQGALLALGAAGCALIGLRVASYDYPSRFVHLTAGVALPLALAAPAVHLLGRVVV